MISRTEGQATLSDFIVAPQNRSRATNFSSLRKLSQGRSVQIGKRSIMLWLDMKKYILPTVIAFIAIIVFVLMRGSKAPDMSSDMMPSGVDPANTTYLIEGERVLFKGGVAETPVSSSSSSTVRTIIFDQPVIGDLDSDGDKDMMLVLQRQTAGSGMFYYLVAALQNPDTTAQGTNALFVGDRIAPQGMSIQFGVATFNYADRKPGEPMTTQPSVGVSLYAVVKNGELIRSEKAQ